MGGSVSLVDGHIDSDAMIDEEVINALGYCVYDDYDYCKKCSYLKNKPCQENLIQDALDLVKEMVGEN